MILRLKKNVCQMNIFNKISLSKNFSKLKAPFLDLKRPANYEPLSVISLLNHTALHYPNTTAYVHGDIKLTWSQTYNRICKFADALSKLGVSEGDVVSIIAPNTPSIFEAHFAIPGCKGAVIHTINTRLDATTIAFQINHAKTKVLLVDSEFGQLINDSLALLPKETEKPILIDIVDPEFKGKSVLSGNGKLTYESFINSGDKNYLLYKPKDEWDAIGLSYTSGTTGNPKGVVHHNRGAYLNAISNALEWNMPKFSQYLWIVPLFHCNGWCFAWTMASIAGTSYFIRQIRAENLFEIINKYKIAYMAGAPIIMNTMLSYPGAKKFTHQVKMLTAGAPPPPSVMKKFKAELGVYVQTAYGLTETYGPMSNHSFDPSWEGLSEDQLVSKSTYQSSYVMQESITVRNPDTLDCVPADGSTIGEIMSKGNITMKGYLANEDATNETFKGGWFRTGDLGVQHPNGRIEIKDRSKDIIISGGENISSIEIESILLRHPAISEAAVIAMPDDKWGEVPCAFVTLNPNSHTIVSEDELIKWARGKMAGFQTPKRIVFSELPKTSTGKVLKHELRKLLPKV